MDPTGNFSIVRPCIGSAVESAFDTHYTEKNQIWKEWQNEDRLTVTLRVDGVNRYEFRLRRLDGCLQICAQDKGYVYYYENMTAGNVLQIKEPQIFYFGKNRQEKYSTTLEFPGHERVILPFPGVTLAVILQSSWRSKD